MEETHRHQRCRFFSGWEKTWRTSWVCYVINNDKYWKGRSYITSLITCLILELHLLTEKMRSYSKSTRKQIYNRKLFSLDVKRSYWNLLNVLPFLTNVPQCQIRSKRGNILFVEVEYNNNNNNNNNDNDNKIVFIIITAMPIFLWLSECSQKPSTNTRGTKAPAGCETWSREKRARCSHTEGNYSTQTPSSSKSKEKQQTKEGRIQCWLMGRYLYLFANIHNVFCHNNCHIVFHAWFKLHFFFGRLILNLMCIWSSSAHEIFNQKISSFG